MKRFLFICLLLITTNLVAQTIYTPSSQTGALSNVKPEIYQKIGKFVIIDSTGTPRTPGKDSVIIFAKGKLGIYYITWEGNVVRLDSATAGGDSIRASFKADTATSPYIARTNIDNNFTVQQTFPKAVTDSIMTLSNMLTIYNEAYFKVGIPDSTTVNLQEWTEDGSGRLSRTGDLTFYTTGDSSSNLRRWSKWQTGIYTESDVNYQTSVNEYGMQMQIEGGIGSSTFTLHSSAPLEYPDPAYSEMFNLYAGDAGNYARIMPELRLGGDNLVLKPSGSNKLLINNNEAIVYTDTSSLAGLGRATNIFSGSLSLTGSSGNTLALETSGLVYDATNNRVGIGTASPSYQLHGLNTLTTAAATTSSFFLNNSITFAADNAQQIRSLNLENTVNDGSYDVGSLYGVYAINRMNWRNDATTVVGIYTVGWFGSNTLDLGTTTTAIGLDAGAVNHFSNIALGTITTATSIIARNQTLTTGDSITITNARGLGVETQTKGTNNTNLLIGTGTTGNWSIYNNSTYDNYFAGKIINNSTVRLKGYTVATLPTGTQGDVAFVTDALAPTYLVTIAGGGAVVTPVFYNGTAWVAH